MFGSGFVRGPTLQWGPLIIAMAVLLTGVGSQDAIAGPIYSFNRLSSNTAFNGSQFTVEVNSVDATHVSFTFRNAVTPTTASSITDVYFDDGSLLGISTITSSAGVAFLTPASPANFPGGNSANFNASGGNYTADSNPGNPGVSENGVNAAGEYLTVVFELQAGKTYTDTINALTLSLANPNVDMTNGLRIGLHAQSLAPTGNSDWFINGPEVPTGGPTVPEPTSMALICVGALGMAGYGWRRRRQAKVADLS